MQKNWLFSRRVLLGFAVFVVIVDQWTKFLADSHLVYQEPMTVFTGFDLLLSYNTGAAFSFLDTAGGWQRWLLTFISLTVSGVILIWLMKSDNKKQKLLRVALAMILGGAVGNLIDRALVGHVVDFISVYYGSWRFATFNIADSAISVGAALLILEMIFSREKDS